MQVYDAVQGVFVLIVDPVSNGAQVIPKMGGTGGLNTRQNAHGAIVLMPRVAIAQARGKLSNLGP